MFDRRTLSSAPPAPADADGGRPRNSGSGLGGSTAAVTRRTSLEIPAGMTIDTWRSLGHQIHVVADSSAWWLGDWLVYGQSQYPDRYRKAVTETGLDYQTLRNYAWVVRRFAPERRRAKLSFQHHAEVAGLPAAEQDEWLACAEEGRWSRNELRRRIRAARTNEGSLEAVHIRMSPSDQQRARWQAAAETTDKDLVEWIVDTLDSAATDPRPTLRPSAELESGRPSAIEAESVPLHRAG